MNSLRNNNNANYRRMLNKYMKKNINNMNKENLKLLAYCWNYYVKTPKFEKINGLLNYNIIHGINVNLLFIFYSKIMY